jgi:phage terminase small subunit
MSTWFEDPENFNPAHFAEDIRNSIVQIHGKDAIIDEHMVCMMTDQMTCYVQATVALRTEPLVEKAINGTRMINPNYKLRDSALTRILQLITMAGLAPATRAKKSEKESSIGSLLEGPKFE